jgi:hypothetical protein
MGQFNEVCFSYPEANKIKHTVYFQREDRDSLPKIILELADDLRAQRSVLVHVEGTRSFSCRTPVEKMSGAFIEMALATNTPIVPVRFTGALPVTPVTKKLEFPVGHGKQDYWLGRPITPQELLPLSYRDRQRRVIEAINNLGPSNTNEAPAPAGTKFSGLVEAWENKTGASYEQSVLFRALEDAENASPEAQLLLQGANAGRLSLSSSVRELWLAKLARYLFGPNGPGVIVQ